MSNQLQALLKSNRVEIVVDLDRDKSISNIRNGLKDLTSNLDFTVDLGVKFNPNVQELNREIKALQMKINESKSVGSAIKLDVEIDTSVNQLNMAIQKLQMKIQNAKTIKPIKLDVVIDVQGSAKKIAQELGDITSVIDRFKGDYSKAISNIQKLGNEEFSELLGDQTVRKLSNNVENVKDYMRNAFGDGIISTKTIKDSQDNIMALSATIKKETGEIKTSMFQLSEDGTFKLFKQTDINNMEAQTAKAKRAISSLGDEIKKISSSMSDSKSLDMFTKLGNQEFVSQGEVNKLKELVKAEKELITTNQKREQFQQALNNSLRGMSASISPVVQEIKKLDTGLDQLDANGIDKAVAKLKELSSQYKSDEQLFDRRGKMLKELNTMYNKMTTTYVNMTKNDDNIGIFNNSQDIYEQAKAITQQATSVRDLTQASSKLREVQKSLDNLNMESSLEKNTNNMRKQVDAIEKTIQALKNIGKYDDDDVLVQMTHMKEKLATSERAVQEFGQTLKKELVQAQQEQKDLIKNFVVIEQHTKDISKAKVQTGIFDALKNNDTGALKRYFGELKNGEVSTIAVTEKTNQFGQAINEVKVKMAGSGKTVEAYTYEVNKASTATDQMVKQTGQSIVDNENKSLGFFAQMGTAMKRVPSWILSMQSFYAVVNGFKSVGSEIMEINAQMIEIQRVAGDGINVDSLFQSATVQAKELGVNIHDVLDALSEFTRSYGDFTESQLLAVNNTAVMMSNVSDLNLSESVENLVGTMNAFNISAEESIHIVDALNEVDNNYSISTKQLADSISKAGATAKTFGLTMEEVAGHTTAIGAVTMESGDIIGNSLKTIYSRITTMGPAIDMLDSLGVSINEMTENGMQVRSVGDILGDLAGKWDGLSDSQRQNAGVTLAGRNQLSRFLALMNNWSMSQDATSAAINSTGSAVREQAVYMDSYEAKVNGLKTRFTELSLSIGEAFLSDGMYLALDGLADFVEMLTELTSKVGVLPLLSSGLLAVGGNALGLRKNFQSLFESVKSGRGIMETFISGLGNLKNSDGLFGNIAKEAGRIKDVFTTMGAGFGKSFAEMGSGFKTLITSMTMARSGIASTATAQSALQVLTMGVGTAFNTVKTAVIGFMSTTGGLTLLLAGIGIVIGKIIEKTIKAKQKTKELIETYNENNQKALEAYNNYGNSFDSLINEYDELNAKMKASSLNTDELARYNELTKQIAEVLPNAVKYTDANGEAHLKSEDAIRKEAKAIEELNRQQQAIEANKFGEKLKESAENYSLLEKNMAKYQQTIKLYKKQQDDLDKAKNDKTGYGYNNTYDYNYSYTPTVSMDKYKEAMAGIQEAQGALSMQLSESSVMVGENVRAWLESEGAMKNISSTGEGFIDTFAKVNQVTLENIEANGGMEASQEKLREKTKAFGDALADAYGQFDDLTEKQSTTAKGLMDDILSGFDDDFWKSNDYKEKLSGIADGIRDVAQNSENLDTEALARLFMEGGLSAEESKVAIMTLGTELENTAIKTAIAREDMSTYNDELTNMATATWEAIDAQKVLLGLQDGEAQDISSRLEYLSAMKELNSTTWLNNVDVQNTLDELEQKTGLARESIQNNTTQIYEAYGKMSSASATEVAKMSNMTWEELKEANEGMTDGGVTLLKTMLDYFESGTSTIQSSLILALSKGAEEIDGNTDRIKKSFEELAKAPNDTNKESNVFNQIKEDLLALQGQISVTEDKNGKLKLAMLNGEKSSYLDEVNKQMETLGISIQQIINPETGELSFEFVGLDGLSHKLFSSAESAQLLDLAVNYLRDNFANFQAQQNEETKSQWLSGMQTQFEQLGFALEVVDEGTDKAKIALADGTTSPWVDAINEQIKTLGGTLVTTTDDAGNLIYKVKNADGTEFELFRQMGESADQAKTKTSEVKEEVEQTKQKANEGATLNIDVVENMFGETSEKTASTQEYLNQNPLEQRLGVDSTEYDTEKAKVDADAKEPKTIQIDFKVLSKADGTVETTQKRIKELLDNIGSLEGGVNDVVSLIDDSLLSKNPLVETLADKLFALGNSAQDAKKKVEELVGLLANTKIEMTSNFKLNGIDEAKTKIEELKTSMNTAKGSIDGAVADIKGALSGIKIGAIDTSAFTNLRNTITQSIEAIKGSLQGYATSVTVAINTANTAMIFNTGGLIAYRGVTQSTLQAVISYWADLRGRVPRLIQDMVTSMIAVYNQGTKRFLDRTIWLKDSVLGTLSTLSSSAVRRIEGMTSAMVQAFRSGTSRFREIASDIPRQIGAGISSNMSSATGSLQTLADTMVSKFKSALGIHSPSRVFEELGGFVIAGLTNGLSGSNLKDLGQQVFKDFGGGAMSSLDDIKMFMEGGFASPNFGGTFTPTSGFSSRVNPVSGVAEHHRGQDYAAPMGTPIKAQAGGTVTYSGVMGTYGNMVEIALGNGLKMRYAHNSRNMVSVGQKITAGQILGLVGSTGRSTGPHVHFEVLRNGVPVNPLGYGRFANGGLIDHRQFAEIGEEGEEMIIPLIEKRRKRGIQLWLETAEKLGINNMYMPTFNNSSAYSGGYGAFASNDGTTSEASGSGEGNAGVVKPQMTPLIKSMQPIFSDNASKTQLDALYKRDSAQLGVDLTESYLTKANTKLKTLTENTLAYRNQLLQIQKLNEKLLSQEKAQLKTTQNRQKAIENELKKLKNTSKHTEAQRKKYNELQQEFDENTKTIWKLEESIDSLNAEIADAKVDIYLDYLDEIGNKWTTAIETIGKASDKLEFQLQKLQYTNPNDIGGQLKIQYDMLEQQSKLEKTYQNQVTAYQKEYNSAVSKYGKNSKQALAIKDMLSDAEEKYQAEVLGTLKLEKEIKDAREQVATDSISALKTYYKQMETLSKNAIAKEKDNLKKSYDEKIKYYDDEIAKINEVYNAKLKERNEEKDEQAYQKQMTEYNEQRVELMQKISLASKDTSLEGKKKLADLQKELLALNEDIAKAQADRADELYERELEKQKDAQIKEAETKKEAEEEAYNKALEEIEAREKAIEDMYNKMINDETTWKNATDAWNKGDTSILTNLVNEMQDSLSQLMGGDGSGILGTENLSPEDIKELVGDGMLDLSNIWLDIKDQLTELNSINKNLNDLNKKNQTGSTVGGTTLTNGSGKAPTTSQSNTSPNLNTPTTSKPSGNSNANKVKATHTVVRGDTLWDLAKKYYNNYYDWKKIQNANGGLNPYTIPIGKKLIIPFDTGGYTGDWFGNDGRIAMLHKKELVLNDRQTKDILDTVTMLERVKSQFNMYASSIQGVARSGESGSTTTFGDINLHFDNFRGTRDEAEHVSEVLLNKLKKKR